MSRNLGGASVRHGHAQTKKKTKIYYVWLSMRKRCHTPSCKDYVNYGGRGITICARWNVFENFLEDMGEKPVGMSLDRINNDGNYEPGNCRWATPKEQTWNSKRVKLITFKGETKPMRVWDKELGFSVGTLRSRLMRGMSVEDAMLAPIRSRS